MKNIKLLFYILFFLSFAIALIGFLSSKLWYAGITLIVYSFLWIFFRRGIPTLFLFLCVLIASVGILLKAQALCMILYSGLSLACWDLTKTELLIGESTQDSNINLYILNRLRLLAAVVVTGVCIILISRFISFEVPFLPTIVLVLAAFFCIGKVILFISKKP